MAYIQPRKNKNGKIISWSIRVQRGYDKSGNQLKPYTATFKPDPERTDKQNEKALNKFVVEFEEKCKNGMVCDDRQTFAEYAEYVISLKERSGLKHNTLMLYRMFLPVINEHIGHYKLSDIRPQHLNKFYEVLSQKGIRRKQGSATAKVNIKKILSERKMTIKEAAARSGIANNTLSIACNGGNIREDKAEAIALMLDIPVNKLFKIKKNEEPLSNKTILEYHRFISVVLEQADREMIIPFNPARKATPPKSKATHANYFQMEDITKILECLEQEPLKWRCMIHLLIITGVRRGELCGLKWDVIDWQNNRIHICNNLLYAPDKGLYEESTKTEESDRYITIPSESMALLKEYRKWYLMQVNSYGDLWHDTNYLFFQEKSGNEGRPMHPDTVNSYLDSFSNRYGLPHINPHAFRHTQASLLYFNGIDSVSISKRLGHSKVSTTSDIYSHIIKEADRRSAECIADVILRPKNFDINDRQDKAE